MNPVILAAGAVIWRYDADGQVLALMIHRPRYDDWSIPKGKIDEGEQLISHDVDYDGIPGDTLLHLACKDKNLEITHTEEFVFLPIGSRLLKSSVVRSKVRSHR